MRRRFTTGIWSMPSWLRSSSTAARSSAGRCAGPRGIGLVAGVARTDLADDDEVVGVGRQRLADPAVHLAGAVERCGVDVVDAEFDRAAQHGDRVVERRLEQLHGAVADAGDRVGADAGRAAGVGLSVMVLLDRETLVEMRRTLRLSDCSRNGGASALAGSVRSDARRNREKLLEVATAAFAAADGRPVSLESIARDAGVGIGTLYRHFPNREALVEAIYRTELAEVAAAAATAAQAASAEDGAAPLDGPLRELRRRQARDGRVAARDVRLRRHAAQARPATASPAPSTCCCGPAPTTAACAPTCRPTTWCPA